MKSLNNFIQEKYLIDNDTVISKHFDILKDVIKTEPTENKEDYIEISGNDKHFWHECGPIWININNLDDKYFIKENLYKLAIKIVKNLNFQCSYAEIGAWDDKNRYYSTFAVYAPTKKDCMWHTEWINNKYQDLFKE